jgi:hypothetical protein
MYRYYILAGIIFFLGTGWPDLCRAANEESRENYTLTTAPDTLLENQIMYNGRFWRNLYYMVHGNQFLFSEEFLPGSLSICGDTFNNISLKYDIFKDELLTPITPGVILQLNKQLVDSFSFSFENKPFHFIKLRVDSLTDSKGYFNVLYKNKTGLYLKYSKKIDKLGDEGKYDLFYLTTQLIFEKDNVLYPVTNKKDLLRVLDEDKTVVKDFIRKNRLEISEKEPESFIPVLRYYDNLGK